MGDRRDLGPRPLTAARRTRAVGIAAAVLTALWLARWPFRSRHYYEWDSAQYAMGVLDFDIYAHRPHPPGYPVWIALLKVLHLAVSDLVLLQVIAAYATCALGAWLMFRFARARFADAGLALVATAMVFWSPPAIVASVIANTYPVDLVASVSLGWLAMRMWRGEARLAPLAAALIALFAGARQSGALMMAPLVGVAMLRALRLDLRAWAKAAAAGVVVLAAWYVPVARMHGGAAALQKYQADNVRMYFSHMSVLYGAPVRLHVEMLENIAWWTAIMLATPLIVALAAFGLRRIVRDDGPRDPAARLGPIFYALWIVPNVVYTTAFHCPKPGYLLLTLPPIALLLAGLVPRAKAPLVAAIVGIASAVLGALHFEPPALDRSTLASVRVADEMMETIQREVGDGDDALVVAVGSALYGPNVRSLEMELPRTRVWGFWTDRQRRDAIDGRERTVDAVDHEVPANVRRIYWVHFPYVALPRSILAAFPGTREIVNGRTSHVFRSDIGPGGIDAHVTLNDASVHLVRAGEVSPAKGCQLGPGFGEGFFLGNPIWGFGPSSTVVVRTPAPAKVEVELAVSRNDVPDQHVAAIIDGATLADLAIARGEQGTVHRLAFDAKAGRNVLELRYSGWNGQPVVTDPGDPNELAVLYARIACTIDGERQVLVP